MNCAVSESPPGAMPLVLLVDDEPEALSWLVRLLRPHYRLSFATDGKGALNKAEALSPDLVLMDIGLPDLDGFALCRRLKASPALEAVPLLFLSSHNEPQRRIDGLALGAVDFIGKDCHGEEVLARVRLHLSLSRRQRSGQAQPEVAPSDPDQALAQTIAAHIRARLDQALTVGAIARHFGLADKGLLRLFREQLGQTVSGFIGEERMRAGQRLLQETNLPVQQIALAVGYGNPGNFSTAFRERHGMTPLAYRLGWRESASSSAGTASA